MSQHIRILPQWLNDLVDGDTDSPRNRSPRGRNKKNKSGGSNGLVTCYDKNKRTEGHSIVMPCSSRGEMNNCSVSSIKMERNENHEEALIKTDPESLKGVIRNINKDVIKQEETTLSCVNEKYDSDETEDELDLNTSLTKSYGVQDAIGNEASVKVTRTCAGTDCLNGGIQDINEDMQEKIAHSSLKEECDRDEKDDELDFNTSVAKSNSVEDSVCNEESVKITPNCASTDCSERRKQDINQDMLMLEQTTLSFVKEECDSDVTEDELDTINSVAKSNHVQDSTCNEEELHVASTAMCVDADTSSSVISHNATSGGDYGSGVNNVNENDSSLTNQNATIQVLRTKCKYGTGCYRKNTQHRQDFSHPGDDDYTTADNRPECEYGLSCYRKNPLHRQHFKHTKKVQKPRQAKRSRKTVKNDESDDDDYDLNDPFIDDGSSDDYEPSSNESEMDASEEEGANSAGDDSDLQAKKNKKLKRKQRH